jgi:RND family efflux transporter MFP subunit
MSHTPILDTEQAAQTLGVSDAKPRRRRWWMLALAVLLAGVLVLPVLGRKPQPILYTTQPAKRGNLVVVVSATGTLEPLKKVDVGIEVSGTIKSVDVDYNAAVKVGQTMAELDTTRLDAQAQQTKAALEAAQARVLQAQASVQEADAQLGRLNRVRELSGGKMPSQNDLDTAKANLARAKADEASARASVAQAQASVDVVRTDIAKAVVRSPINGVVLKRSVEPGQTVAAQFQSPTLFTLAEDLTQMELQVDVDEADVGQVKEGQDDNFNVMDMKEIASMLSGTTTMMTMLLGAVAAVSLLVGGIGIMNIMLVSVTERTREIGTRLAIGALEREVLLQFLVESVAISSLGGLIGIAIALLASTSLAGVLQVPFVFNAPIVLVGFAFSAAVGVLFGYVPARKAARLDPIEALRHE